MLTPKILMGVSICEWWPVLFPRLPTKSSSQILSQEPPLYAYLREEA